MNKYYRPHLHQCAADRHFHIILNPENISWPFWSLEAGMKMVDFIKDQFMGPGTPHEVERIAAMEHIRGLIKKHYARTQCRNRRGRFTRGFEMPREFMYCESNVASFWIKFKKGERREALFIDSVPLLGEWVMPLYCDFVGRDQPRPESADKRGWETLAEAPARVITMSELNLTLEPLA